MANSITKAETYLPILDGIYRQEARTALLEAANSNVRFLGGNAVELFKTSIDGLADYARNTGFVSGAVTGTWEKLTLAKDRGTEFLVDNMDNEETLGMAFGTLAGEFLRTKVIPEVDAYRFATLGNWTGVTAATAADITVGTTDVPALIDAAQESLSDSEVPYEGRILFVSEKCYSGLKNKLTRTILNGENGINREVETFDGAVVVRVPKNRFCDSITLNNGSSKFGYTIASTAKPFNFILCHPSAVVAVTKHAMPRIFTPEQYQKADAYSFQYRIYHDLFVEDNKVNGIYVHKAATAIGTAIDC